MSRRPRRPRTTQTLAASPPALTGREEATIVEIRAVPDAADRDDPAANRAAIEHARGPARGPVPAHANAPRHSTPPPADRPWADDGHGQAHAAAAAAASELVQARELAAAVSRPMNAVSPPWTETTDQAQDTHVPAREKRTMRRKRKKASGSSSLVKPRLDRYSHRVPAALLAPAAAPSEMVNAAGAGRQLVTPSLSEIDPALAIFVHFEPPAAEKNTRRRRRAAEASSVYNGVLALANDLGGALAMNGKEYSGLHRMMVQRAQRSTEALSKLPEGLPASSASAEGGGAGSSRSIMIDANNIGCIHAEKGALRVAMHHFYASLEHSHHSRDHKRNEGESASNWRQDEAVIRLNLSYALRGLRMRKAAHTQAQAAMTLLLHSRPECQADGVLLAVSPTDFGVRTLQPVAKTLPRLAGELLLRSHGAQSHVGDDGLARDARSSVLRPGEHLFNQLPFP